MMNDDRTDYTFKFGPHSVCLDDMKGFAFNENINGRVHPKGKPVRVFHTSGMQIIGIPQELLRVMDQSAIERAGELKTVLTAHFETPDALYLLRIDNFTYMAMPRQPQPCRAQPRRPGT